jgi:hypothetical protein
MNLGAPGLAFETWETANLHGRNTRQPAKLPGAYRASAEARYQVRIESEAAISKQAALQKSLSRWADKHEGLRTRLCVTSGLPVIRPEPSKFRITVAKPTDGEKYFLCGSAMSPNPENNGCSAIE